MYDRCKHTCENSERTLVRYKRTYKHRKRTFVHLTRIFKHSKRTSVHYNSRANIAPLQVNIQNKATQALLRMPEVEFQSLRFKSSKFLFFFRYLTIPFWFPGFPFFFRPEIKLSPQVIHLAQYPALPSLYISRRPGSRKLSRIGKRSGN